VSSRRYIAWRIHWQQGTPQPSPGPIAFILTDLLGNQRVPSRTRRPFDKPVDHDAIGQRAGDTERAEQHRGLAGRKSGPG
jgi:hypothetical protein